MGSKRLNSNNNRARSVECSSPPRRTRGPKTGKNRPAIANDHPTELGALDDGSLEAIGKALRTAVTRLEQVEAYLMVAGSSLEGMPSYSGCVVTLLRFAVGDLMFKQIRTLEDLAAQCDGGPGSERDHEDDDDEDTDLEASL